MDSDSLLVECLSPAKALITQGLQAVVPWVGSQQ